MKFTLTRYKQTLPILETIAYYTVVVASLGTVWLAKIVLKKAIEESQQDTK